MDVNEDLKSSFNLPTIPDSYNDFLELTDNNPNLIAAEYDKKLEKNNVSIAKSAILPVVSLSGELSKRSGLSSLSSSREISNETATLNITVPLYQSGAEYSQVRAAKKRLKNAVHKLSETRKSVISAARTAWQQVITTKADIEATELGIESAKLALDGVKEEKDVGSRTTLDVLDAEQELFTAQIRNLAAKRNSILAIYDTLSATGNLTAKNLNLNVTPYNPQQKLNNTKYKMIGY